MFSKIDGKVMQILIIALVVILLGVFIIISQYFSGSLSSVPKVQDLTGGAQTENNSINKTANNTPSVQVQIGGVQANGENGGGILTVCMDKCGDGICQKTDPNCGKNNTLNCICPETSQNCPKDCK